MSDKLCSCGKPLYVKGLCEGCYNKDYAQTDKAKASKKRYRENNLDKIKEQDIKRRSCIILKKHHDDLKDDPEHLTTEFLQKLIGIKCGNK